MDKKKKAGLAVLIIIALYVAASIFFQYHYFIGTKVNGYSCAFRSVSKAKELIKKDVKSYKITIKERDKKKESVSSSQVKLAFKDDESWKILRQDRRDMRGSQHYSSLRIIKMRLL